MSVLPAGEALNNCYTNEVSNIYESANVSNFDEIYVCHMLQARAASNKGASKSGIQQRCDKGQYHNIEKVYKLEVIVCSAALVDVICGVT